MFNTAGIGKSIASTVKKAALSSVADTIDLLHSLYTVILLTTFAVVAGSGQLFGKPLQCLIAAHIDKVRGWSAYILGYCYVVGTTKQESIDSIPTEEDRLKYYQWLPLFFCFQIFCFRFLHLFWLWLQSLLYIDVKTVLKESNSLTKVFDPKLRKEKAQQIAEYIWGYFYFRTLEAKGWQRIFIHPAVFTWFYFIIKICNLVHVLIQLVSITKFLGFNDGWVLKIFAAFLASESSNHTYFPQTVYCTYKITTSNDIVNGQTYTSQCFLTINEYNEKILIILWVWFIIVSSLSLLNLLYFLRFFTGQMFTTYVQELSDHDSELCKASQQFFSTLMGSDGLLILHLISSRSGSMTSSLILKEIWNKYARSTKDRIPEYALI
ncbi:unnamed protein product [Auanema sp. JU1783]|nr:unnamed protein product [Auanema sp. JU1783]